MNTISKQFCDDIAESLFSRLDYIKCKPLNILILGEVSDEILNDLQKRYPKASVTLYAESFEKTGSRIKSGMAVKSSMTAWMGKSADQNGKAKPLSSRAPRTRDPRKGLIKMITSWILNIAKPIFSPISNKFRSNTIIVSGTIQNIPFQKNEFDVIVSNLYFYQEPDLDKLYAKLAEILEPEGLLLFSTFGPDTPLPKYQFADMHDVGDALLKAGFKDPVMDAERIKKSDDIFEVVYGHAWGGVPKRQTVEEDGTVKISVNDLFKK